MGKNLCENCRSQCWAHLGYKCVDCGVCTKHDEYYMVHPEIWAKSGVGPDDGMLCVKDLETRIGRTLTKYDFTGCPLNRNILAGHVPAAPILFNRMTSGPTLA